MLRFKVAFILSLACVALVSAGMPEIHPPRQEGPHPDAPSHPENGSFPWPWKTSTTTTTTPTPSTTTLEPTTKPPTTTSTHAPPPSPPTTTTTTTTQAPPTPPPTTTTTPAPHTTTPAPAPGPKPAPTPAPSPAPKSDRGNWTVSGENVTCIYLQAAVSAKVHYPLISKGLGQVTVEIPNDAVPSGTCDNTTDVLTLTWGKHKAVFTFQKIVKSSQYDLATVALSFAADNKTFPNVSQAIESLEYKSSAPVFITTLGYSYQCTAQKTVPLLNGTAPNGTEIVGSLEFSKLHLQGFSEEHMARFGSPEDCEEDASDMVPIVVGCVLAALVVIILGVYVWGRRRTNRGYVSM